MKTSDHGPAGHQGRRTRQEQGAATRDQLLDATIGCLVELGYGSTTTTVIAERAGVSRGAQQHHFPTKEELVTAALRLLVNRFGQDLARLAALQNPAADRLTAAIGVLWSGFCSPFYLAWLELWTAARTDDNLRRAIEPLEAEIRAAVEWQLRRLFLADGRSDSAVDELLELTYPVLQGLAIERALSVADSRTMGARHDRLLSHWTQLVTGARLARESDGAG